MTRRSRDGADHFRNFSVSMIQELLFTLIYNLVVALKHARSFEEIARLNRSLQAQNMELEKAYRELQEAQADRIEKEKLQRELHLAWEIQHSMLPRSLPRALPGLTSAPTSFRLAWLAGISTTSFRSMSILWE